LSKKQKRAREIGQEFGPGGEKSSFNCQNQPASVREGERKGKVLKLFNEAKKGKGGLALIVCKGRI